MQMAIPITVHPTRPAVRVMNNADIERIEAENAASEQAIRDALEADKQVMSDLAAYVEDKYEQFSQHRNTNAGWSDRMLSALRSFNGIYSAEKLAYIREFGGSEVYARLVAMKCRGATALLRDVYLSPERAWGIGPPSDPDVPQEVAEAIQQLVVMELMKLAQAGAPPDLDAARDRAKSLYMAARDAEKKNAAKRAKHAEEKIEEIFQEGGFYIALSEFLVDLPLFPFACIKGPEVRIMNTVKYVNGVAQVTQLPKLCWSRVSPFDIYFTPGASSIDEADVIERVRTTRAELNDCLDLPGFNHEAIRAVLEEYGSGGITDDWDYTDTERAMYENRENPRFNRSGMMNMQKFTGNIQGTLLIDYGMMDPQILADPVRDFNVELWKIGRHVIKCQLTPSPRKRHNYYITSFEKVPGTPVGNALPDILADIEEVCNATLRTLVNNMAMSSGPQVVVMDDRLTPGADGEDIYPWKRWHVQSDPASANNGQAPIDFFQPNSNAQELMAIYQFFNSMADEISAIPKYLSGQGVGSGAGRTASGLAMLMGNANKILQTVAANVDRDIMDPVLGNLYDMLMMTDTEGFLTGDENIVVKGVNVAIQRETERSRQLEFLAITANPIDAPIIGLKGRANVLRSVASSIGLDGQAVVPSEEEIDSALQAQQMAQAAAGPQPQEEDVEGEETDPAAEAQGNQTPRGGRVTQDMGPRTQIAGGAG